MKISVFGLTASGKTYHAKSLADKFGLTYLSGSDYLLQSAGIHPLHPHFWVSEEGEQFTERRKRDLSIDKRADDQLLADAYNGTDLVIDSWAVPWLYAGNLFRIYLVADLRERALRAYQSRVEKPYTLGELRERIRKKDEDTAEIMQRLYGFNIFDTSISDLIVNTNGLTQDQIARILASSVRAQRTPMFQAR